MKKIGELLVEQGKISERDVERALLAQKHDASILMDGLFVVEVEDAIYLSRTVFRVRTRPWDSSVMK